VAGEAADPAAARAAMEQLQPALVVLDLLLGGRDGVELVEDLRAIHPAGRVLVYTSQSERAYADRALRAGASGYLMKSAGPAEVLAALERIAAGDFVVSPVVQQLLLARTAAGPASRAGDPLAELSDRELQVFRLVGAGRGTGEIAAELNLSPKTIGTYRERLKDKLNCQSARELDRRAFEYVHGGYQPPLR
jgi:DNA-binding NarL/FixJ family response regulator